jgi:DNA-binding MarR family transcriptional regulator
MEASSTRRGLNAGPNWTYTARQDSLSQIRDQSRLKASAAGMARKLRYVRSQRAASSTVPLKSPLRESPSFLVRLTQLGAFDEFHRHFAGLGVTPARFSVFALIVTNPGVRPGALSEELRVKPSNIAALVNALVADGFVERERDESELRANQLRPTKRGLKAFTEMWDIHCQLDKLLLEPLTAAERKEFVRLMQKIDRV